MQLANGAIIEAEAVVVATEEAAARKLLGEALSTETPAAEGTGGDSKAATPEVQGRGSTCLYYSFAGPPPVGDPLLILNGEGSDPTRPINNLVFLSSVAPSYAPDGQTLVSVTVVGVPKVTDTKLDQLVRAQMADWFGGKVVVDRWQLLKVYRIPYAQPTQVRVHCPLSLAL